MGMPELPQEIFSEGLKQLVNLDKDWIPKKKGSAMYLRPFMYADEHFIGMRAATSYKFIIICSPAGPYFSERIKLFAEKKFIIDSCRMWTSNGPKIKTLEQAIKAQQEL